MTLVTINLPRYLAGANSEIIKGAINDAIPTPQPKTNRPAIIVHTVRAANCIIVPTTKMTFEPNKTLRLPIKFANTPPTTAPRRAPNDVAEVINSFSPDVRILLDKSVPI